MKLDKDIRKFAEQMKLKFDANNYKGGWSDDTPEDLLIRLREETTELENAIEAFENNWPPTDDRVQCIIKEAADVANFALMIVSVVEDKHIYCK